MCIFRNIAFFLPDIGGNRRVTTTLPKCEACGKAVYLTEKLSAEDGNTFHKVLPLYAVLSPKQKQRSSETQQQLSSPFIRGDMLLLLHVQESSYGGRLLYL